MPNDFRMYDLISSLIYFVLENIGSMHKVFTDLKSFLQS